MYRPGEVANKLGIKPVTLRVWSNEFADFLSESAKSTLTSGGSAAQRRYNDSDIAILQRAKGLLASGKTYDETRRALAGEEPPQSQALQAIEEMTGALARMQSTYDRLLESRDQTIATQQTAMDEQRQHIETLKEHIDRQQAEIDALRRPWWRRLRRDR
jgi:DNA-binding transcriptional MerR regulator